MESIEIGGAGSGAAVINPQFSHHSVEGASLAPGGPGAAPPPAPAPAPAPVPVPSHQLPPAAGGGGGGAPPPQQRQQQQPQAPSRAAPAAHAFPPSLQAALAPPPPGGAPVVAAPTKAELIATAKKSNGVGDALMKAAQWGLQQLGARHASPDSPEMAGMFFRLARIEAELEELRNTALHFYNVRRVLSADRIKYNNAVAACGSHSKLGSTQASDVVRQFAAVAHRLESYNDDLDRAFYALVVHPINELLINECRTARELQKTYESHHLEFDARQLKYSEVREDPKIPETAKRVSTRKEAKLELDRITSLFTGVQDQLRIVFGVILSKRNTVFNESLTAYMKSEYVCAQNTIGALEQHSTGAGAAGAAAGSGVAAGDQKSPVTAAGSGGGGGAIDLKSSVRAPPALDIKSGGSGVVISSGGGSGSGSGSGSGGGSGITIQPAPPAIPSPGAMASAAPASPVGATTEPVVTSSPPVSATNRQAAEKAAASAEPGSPHHDGEGGASELR